MKVVLIRKLADEIDGVNVRDYRPGDVVDVPLREARLLVLEEWAIPDRRERQSTPPVERRGY